MRTIVIVGCGGFGREVYSLIQALPADQKWVVEGFVDDDPSRSDGDRVTALGSRVLGTVAQLGERAEPFAAVIAVGSTAARAAIATRLAASPVEFPPLIHPDATLGRTIEVSPGVVIAPGARLSTNIVLGPHVHVDQNATIGHDSRIGAFARLNPQACVSGSVDLGERVVIGASATVLPGLHVGDGAVVGAAACVVRDVTAGAVVKGVPAR